MSKNPENLHIDAPEELTSQERARDTLITALLWAVYLYLWVPMVSLFAWALGFEFAYDVMVRAGGARDLVGVLLRYSVVVALILSIFTIWSVSNRLRYKDLNRRHRRHTVPDEAMVEYFRVSMTEVRALRASQVMHVEVDESGRPELVATGLGYEAAQEGWLDESISDDAKKAV